MKTKMRYLTTVAVATAAMGAAINFAPIAVAADPGSPSGGGGTGSDTSGLDANTGPGLSNGGSPAGATGPDVASGAGFWSGGESAGAVG